MKFDNINSFTIIFIAAVVIVGFFDDTKLFCGQQDQIFALGHGNETIIAPSQVRLNSSFKYSTRYQGDFTLARLVSFICCQV